MPSAASSPHRRKNEVHPGADLLNGRVAGRQIRRHALSDISEKRKLLSRVEPRIYSSLWMSMFAFLVLEKSEGNTSIHWIRKGKLWDSLRMSGMKSK